MKQLMLAAAFAVFAVAALPAVARADGPTCTASATDKKLAGAAKTSFTKKCVKDSVGG